MQKTLKWITLFSQWNNAMDIDPSELLLFARIVECGGFSLAAGRVELEFVVQDTGIGIAPEALPRLFERVRGAGR